MQLTRDESLFLYIYIYIVYILKTKPTKLRFKIFNDKGINKIKIVYIVFKNIYIYGNQACDKLFISTFLFRFLIKNKVTRGLYKILIIIGIKIKNNKKIYIY